MARVWIEEEADELLRARITHSVDIAADEPVVLTAAGPEEVYSAIRSWLDAFLLHCLSTAVVGGTW